jgi:DNA-binding response OmpR family regulator
MHSERILIVDDDENLASLLKISLEDEGFLITIASNGETALRKFREDYFTLVILDLTLPEMSGIEVCRAIRQQSRVAIIVLTGNQDNDVQLECLRCGADDYVTKPFDNRILLARIDAVLNRISEGNAPFQNSNYYNDGYLLIDYSAHSVKISGKEIALTPKEYNLLYELTRQAGTVMEYEKLLTRVWGEEYKDDKNLLYRHINSLRRKIEPDPDRPRYIITVAKTGYRFDMPH